MFNRLSFTDSRSYLGSDPEFFFVKKKEMVPSKDVVPEKTGEGWSRSPKWVIRDGFQGELNPASDTCRQSAGSMIALALIEAKSLADKSGHSISFKMGHVVSDKQWKRATKEEKRFGCSPTMNIYSPRSRIVTGMRERFRAAGGHVHFSLMENQKENLSRLVAVMDIVVGNTCVMIDRDPNNARRRKIYGRAGEYRVKSYGMEYRVLSNFWLRSYTLWSLVSQLGRNAISIEKSGMSEELIARFDMRKIRRAINNNDIVLARENFEILKQFLIDHRADGNGLSVERLPRFTEWFNMKEPLFFCNTTTKVMAGWQNKLDTGGSGIESFIDFMKYKKNNAEF